MSDSGPIRTVADDELPADGATTGGRVDRFVVLGVLGHGGMGVVLSAHDPQLDRRVALKLLGGMPGDGRTEARLREARAMARLSHPNVVVVHEVGAVGATVYIVMEQVTGGTLRAWLGAQSRSSREVLAVLLPVGGALAAAHAAAIVHRDFKPENVLIGDDGRPSVADFGLASLDAEPGVEGGTRGYTAPEQAAGAAGDERADQYAFCVTLWEALFGERPIAGTPPPRDRRRVPRPIIEALRRGLAARPEDRWPSMTALLAALQPSRTRRLAVMLAVAGVALAIAVLMATRSDPSSTPEPALGLIQLTHRRELRLAQISPDGTTLAYVAGEALVVRGVDRGAVERVIIPSGVRWRSLSWSPDGKRVVVSMATDTPDRALDVVELERGTRERLPLRGLATFLSNAEVAVIPEGGRTVEILRIGERAPATRCDVPGDYARLESIAGAADGTMMVHTSKSRNGAVVIMARDCRILGSYGAYDLSSAALTDTGTVVGLVDGVGFGNLIELALDGSVLSHRRVSGDLQMVLGRRKGIDYVILVAPKTNLDRIRGTSPPTRLFSASGISLFAVAPGSDTLAWVERGRLPHGPMWILPVSDLDRRGAPLRDGVIAAAWSPDGDRLATLVTENTSIKILVITRRGEVQHTLPLERIDPWEPPVWISGDRVAARSDDGLTYLWFDLNTSEQGELFDRTHGATWWVSRSPRDGTLAMWRAGRPGGAGRDAEHIWLMAPGEEPEPVPLRTDGAATRLIVPSWSHDGELVVHDAQTGVVSRVAPATGELTAIAQLSPGMRHTEPVMPLPDGDFLAREREIDWHVAAAGPE